MVNEEKEIKDAEVKAKLDVFSYETNNKNIVKPRFTINEHG